MKLLIDKSSCIADKKFEVMDLDNNVVYYCQPDFSYKKRLHLLDKKNNRIAYIQYKILSIQNDVEYYTFDDEKIDLSSYEMANIEEDKCSCLMNNSLVFTVCEDGGKIIIEMLDEANVVLCLLFFLGNIE